jgi:hypothetical protein
MAEKLVGKGIKQSVLGDVITINTNTDDVTINGSLTLEGTIQLKSYTTTEKNALTAINGMIVYDSTLGKFQGYEAGAWVSLI